MEAAQPSVLDHVRASFGVASLSELRGRPLGSDAFNHVVDAYLYLASSVKAPPPKESFQLRPTFMTSVVSPYDEAEVAARALLLYHSVAVILPDSINYPRRMLRLLTLLEELIDDGLVVLLPEEVMNTRKPSYFEIGLGIPDIGPAPGVEHAMLMVDNLQIAVPWTLAQSSRQSLT